MTNPLETLIVSMLEDLEVMARSGLRMYLVPDKPFTGEQAAFMSGMALGMLSKYGGDRLQRLLNEVHAELDTTHS